MLAKMTIWGIESFLNSEDKSLFDDISLPEGIDKDILIDSIFLRANEFPVLYTDPYYFRYMSGAFFRKFGKTFEEWAYAMSQEYNPIYNYDRFEEYTDDQTGNKNGNINKTDNINRSRISDANDTRNLSGSDRVNESGNSTVNSRDIMASSESGTDTGSKSHVETSTGTEDVTSTDKKAVTNNSNWNNYEQNTIDKDTTDRITSSDNDNLKTSRNAEGTTDSTQTGSNTNNRQGSRSELEDTHRREDVSDNEENNSRISDIESTSNKNVHTGHLWGNIGVTTSTMMVTEYMKARKEFNLYDLITDMYVAEFCILVY